MEEILSKDKCTGCSLCASICPKDAIRLVSNNEGFKYPVIDKKKCIDCGLCKKMCPVLKTKENASLNLCYAGYNKDELERSKASSGGIFSLIANKVLDDGGVVIGASFNKDNKLIHIAVTNKKDLDKLKGSKYLQSDIVDVYSYIRNNINDKMILFVGTPCQVAGIKKLFNSDNLICVDFVCHGVPSPKLFLKYIKELESKNNDKLIGYNFRDKVSGWDNYSNTFIFKKSIRSELAKDNKYMKLFLADVALRRSCYNCNFKLGNKYSDITLGDFWGIDKIDPEMYDNKGVSLIVVNTKLGKDLFNSIKDNMVYKKCNLDDALIYNKSLERSCTLPLGRDRFFNDIDKYSIDKLTKKYVKKPCFVIRILSGIKRVIFR